MSNEQPDLGALLQQAQALQEQLLAAQAEAEQQQVVGQAAGGKVAITTTGALEFVKVHIDKDVTDDVEMLEDLILAALHDAAAKVEEIKKQAAGGLGGMLGGMLGQ